MPGPNEKLTPGERVVYFGKYNGKKFSEVPIDYLEWLVAQPPVPKGMGIKGNKTSRACQRWAQDELKRRLEEVK